MILNLGYEEKLKGTPCVRGVHKMSNAQEGGGEGGTQNVKFTDAFRFGGTRAIKG
jgi:hypothetical protein